MLLVLLLAFLTGCAGGPVTDTARADVQRLLERRSAAVLERDAEAFTRTGALSWFENARGVPFASWSYHLTDFTRDGDRATALAELSYRLQGHDPGPVRANRELSLSRAPGGGWRIDAERPAEKSAEQLWDQGKVTVVRGRHSLVLGSSGPTDPLQRYADLADRAVPAVSDAWGEDWARRVVVLVPASLDGMAGLLGSPASSYRGIAAVTTGETGGREDAPADRVIVNPEAYGVLGDIGKQVVLTHETTHVATRGHTTSATPLWLSEGYADWVGYRDAGRSPAQAAPELWHAVSEGRVPERLPEDAEFAFSTDAAALARAYESGWMACRMIAEQWGEDRLRAFYEAVGAHEDRDGAVEAALEDILGTDLDGFTRQWRTYVEEQLG